MMGDLLQGDRKKLAIAIAIMLGFFLVMVVLRLSIESRLGEATDVEATYESLLAELANSGLLFPDELDQGLNAISVLAVDPFAVDVSYAEGSPTIGVKLDGVLEMEFIEGAGALKLELHPQEYKSFKPGPLQTALRELSKLKQEQQARALSGAGSLPTKTFSISLNQDNQMCRITPAFTGDKCTAISIRQIQ